MWQAPLILLVSMASGAHGAALAAVDEPAFLACASIDDDRVRLACYDRAARAAAPQLISQQSQAQTFGQPVRNNDLDRRPNALAPVAATPPPTVQPPSAAVATAASAAVAETVATEAEATEGVTILARDSDGEVTRIGMTLIEVRAGRNGRRVFTMSNGQTWLERETPSTHLPRRMPDEGVPVEIRRASLGSYLMSVDGRRSIRVARTD